ncbi:MAG: M20/M25/M40 family metallo-hydrolase [Bacteroidales bacterium]|nr:M20/M25/M40 family metallo-hydrolase [Lentimicrobiaceae bacterium]MDD5695570.1 M20/M25/M40 family metallo-hydrolase [Bacteroidales bacterium]
MKKTILLLTGLFFALQILAGDLVKIPVKDECEMKQYLKDPNLTVHYCSDYFIIATAELQPAFNHEIIISGAWVNPSEYFLAWFKPGQSESYVAEIQPFADILYKGTDHLILEVQYTNVKFLFPAVHNGLVRITSSPVKLPRQTFAFQKSRVESDPLVNDMLSQVNQDTLLSFIQHLQDYGTRNAFSSQAVLAQNWIKSKFESYGLQTELMNFYMPGGSASDNVIATLPGTAYPEEYVMLGGHYDSFVWSGQAPGADDNASGTAAVLEIARLLSQNDYKRTIIFCAWSGEEYGLYGSEAYASMAEEEEMNILGYFNQDMNGYLEPGDEMHTDVMAPASAQELKAFYKNVCETYLPDFGVYNGTLIGGDSDHSSFNDHGIMGIFPFEDSQDYSPYIHSSNDLIGPSVNNMEQVAVFTQSILASVVTMADMQKVPNDLMAFPSDESVTLVWSEILEASSYNIYKNGSPTPMAGVIGTSYTDTDVENGTAYTYYITVIYTETGEESEPSNSVTVIPMPPITVPFMDDFETSAPYWSMGGTWGLTDAAYHSASYSLTDSPAGLYSNNVNTSVILQSINMTGITGGTISFWAKYSLETDYDYVYLEVTTNGTDWSELAHFTGEQPLWQYHEFPIDPFVNQPGVTFRFRLFSDITNPKDGIYIDDLQINTWTIGLDEQVSDPSGVRIFPNPFSQAATIEFCLPASTDVRIDILSLDGKTVRTLMNAKLASGNHSLIWDGKDGHHAAVKPGIYFIRVLSDNRIALKKTVLMP